MRRDLKKYFEVHFGSFARQTAAEIEQACLQEPPLPDLEGFWYLKKDSALYGSPLVILSSVIHQRLTNLLTNAKN